MASSQFNRRDFNRLTVAALGGMLAGAAAGCGEDNEAPAPAGTTPANTSNPPAGGSDGKTTAESGDAKLTDAQQIMLEEPHVCRGLNTCKNRGAGKENACAGQGTCATAAAHDCHEMNECKGQGGCGESVGRNACKAKGECSVPLNDAIWKKARAAFEDAMKASGKDIGTAPAKA